MKVGVGLVGHVVVDGDVDTLDIDTTTEDVSGDTDTGLELLKLLVALDTICELVLNQQAKTVEYIPLFLTDSRVDSSAGEVALAKELVELRAAKSRTDEDDDLVELQAVEKVVELAVLLLLVKLHVVLLETVKCQLLLVIDVDLERVLHELLADNADVLVEGGREHHNLLVLGSSTEDGLDIIAHVCQVLARISRDRECILTGLVQHLVALVEDKVLQVGKAKMPVAYEGVDTTGGTDNDVGVSVLVAQELDVLLDGSSTVEDTDLDVWQELGETVVLVADLVGQLTSVAHDQNSGNARLRLLVHLLESCENEDGSLSETGLGLAEDIVS